MSRLRLDAYLCTPYSSVPQVPLRCQDAIVPSMPQCPGCRLPLYILMSSLLLKFSEDAWGSLDCYAVCIFPFLPNPVSSFWSDLVPLRSLDPLHLMGVTSHTPLLAGSAVLPVLMQPFVLTFIFSCGVCVPPILFHSQGPCVI